MVKLRPQSGTAASIAAKSIFFIVIIASKEQRGTDRADPWILLD